MDGILGDRLGKLAAAFCVVLLLAMFLPVVTFNLVVVQSIRGLDVAGFWAFIALILGAGVVAAPRVPQIAAYRNLIAIVLGGLLVIGLLRVIYVMVRIGDTLGQAGMGDLGAAMNDAISYGYIGILAILVAFGLGFLVALEGWKLNKTSPAT